MNAPTERALIRGLFKLRADRVGRAWHPRRAIILMYHGFTAEASHDGIQNHEHKHLHVESFRAHLEFLKAHYHVVPLADLVRAFTTGAPLPSRPAVITIDDGYRSVYSVAYPALQQAGLPAAVFLATEFVDERRFLWTDRVEHAVNRAATGTYDVDGGGERLRIDLNGRASRMEADRRLRSALKRLSDESRAAAVDALEQATGQGLGAAGAADALYQPMSWDEAREMAASGLVAIGSHGHTHAIISRCRSEQAARELRVSKRIIDDRLGSPCELFCYPNGRRGDFNAETRRMVVDAGFSSALTTVYGMNAPGTDVYQLRRYNLGKPMMKGEVEVRLAGLLG